MPLEGAKGWLAWEMRTACRTRARKPDHNRSQNSTVMKDGAGMHTKMRAQLMFKLLASALPHVCLAWPRTRGTCYSEWVGWRAPPRRRFFYKASLRTSMCWRAFSLGARLCCMVSLWVRDCWRISLCATVLWRVFCEAEIAVGLPCEAPSCTIFGSSHVKAPKKARGLQPHKVGKGAPTHSSFMAHTNPSTKVKARTPVGHPFDSPSFSTAWLNAGHRSEHSKKTPKCKHWRACSKAS